MSNDKESVRHYHRQTKHHTQAYAPSPGFLDWDSQPNPSRRYQGAPFIELPLINKATQTSFADIYTGFVKPQPVTKENLSLFFELALGLSTWKTTGMESWALRHKPSSGNLHPTEAYLILLDAIDKELLPGVYHYTPYEHGLEQRATFSPDNGQDILANTNNSFAAIGLSSIHWREEWKYGSRALRYCQHDVGHALAAIRYSASILGWRVQVDTSITDQDIRDCLGLNHQIDANENNIEQEAPDLIAFISEYHDQDFISEQISDFQWSTLAKTIEEWQGQANQLSAEHAYWPQISKVMPALEKNHGIDPFFIENKKNPFQTDESHQQTVEKIIRQRRSAQRMVLGTGISKAHFFQMLSRTLANKKTIPFDAFPFKPAINLVLFVHQVEGLDTGLYTLIRTADELDSFQTACANPSLRWAKVRDCHLPLYTLTAPYDFRKQASKISCYQGIAGHSAFSLGMIANVDETLNKEGAWSYRRLFWEAGLIGQILYLEAVACGVSATGIGCYFDDSVHQLLGLENEGPWQSLYHFTVGAAREDQRLTNLPGYHHLNGRNNG